MGKNSNQEKVLSLLTSLSSHEMSEKDLRAQFKGKCFKKIVEPMLDNGMILKTGSGYKLNEAYSAQKQKSTKAKRKRKAKKQMQTDYSEMIKNPIRKEEMNQATGKMVKTDVILPRNNGRFLNLKDCLKLETPKKARRNESNIAYLILLNKHNSEVVEQAIKNDEAYNDYIEKVDFFFKEKYPNKEYRYDYKSVLALIRIIDYENSTNVWRMKRDAIRQMTDFIIDKRHKFWARLEKGDVKLVDKLVEVSKTTKTTIDKDTGEQQQKTAREYSLSSKVCKFLAQHEFPGTDHYFINDNFVRHVLSYYCRYYRVKINENAINNQMKYRTLFKMLEKLRNKVNGIHPSHTLSRHCLDHLMWYCYKDSGDVEDEEE